MGGFGPLFFYIHMRDCDIKAPKGNDDYAMRSCLRCNKKFNSQSNANRICENCKEENKESESLPQIWQECAPINITYKQSVNEAIIKHLDFNRHPSKRRKRK